MAKRQQFADDVACLTALLASGRDYTALEMQRWLTQHGFVCNVYRVMTKLRRRGGVCALTTSRNPPRWTAKPDANEAFAVMRKYRGVIQSYVHNSKPLADWCLANWRYLANRAKPATMVRLRKECRFMLAAKPYLLRLQARLKI